MGKIITQYNTIKQDKMISNYLKKLRNLGVTRLVFTLPKNHENKKIPESIKKKLVDLQEEICREKFKQDLLQCIGLLKNNGIKRIYISFIDELPESFLVKVQFIVLKMWKFLCLELIPVKRKLIVNKKSLQTKKGYKNAKKKNNNTFSQKKKSVGKPFQRIRSMEKKSHLKVCSVKNYRHHNNEAYKKLGKVSGAEFIKRKINANVRPVLVLDLLPLILIQ